jgi:hypothetical protein
VRGAVGIIAPRPSRKPPRLFRRIRGIFFHALVERFFFGDLLLGGVFADVFRYLHRAKMRAAHIAEMGGFRPLLWQGFIVEFAGGDGVEAEVELVFPAEFEAGFAEKKSTRGRV